MKKRKLKRLIASSSNRKELWVQIVQHLQLKTMAEIGVYKGVFSAQLLSSCPNIEQYYMIDPWRNLSNWNKTANHQQAYFDSLYQ
jgi:hypothetical protein